MAYAGGLRFDVMKERKNAMIYTVTLNPSIDYLVRLDEFVPGRVNRSASETVMPGGKGINVSLMLRHLGVESTALGFTAGFTGEEIRRLVRAEGVSERFISLEDGFSRINVKVKSGIESELNGAGPTVPPEALSVLMRQLGELDGDDILVLSGSVPPSVPNTVYRDMAAVAAKKGVKFVTDAAGALLLQVLPYRPFLVKPNHHELGALFGVEIHTREAAASYASRLREMGAQNVLVSMAEKGAVLVCENGVLFCDAPHGEVKNSVGAGDSMVAGFLAGYLETADFHAALRMGIAAGSASAFSEGIAQTADVHRLLSEIQ